MKRLITLLFLLATVPLYAQSVHITVKGVPEDSVFVTVEPPKPAEKKYVPIPAEPVFTNPNTINLPGDQQIFASELGGKTEQILTGTSPTLTLNGIGGTLVNPIRFKGGTINGTSQTQRSVRTLNSTLFFSMYGLKTKGNDGGLMLSAPTDANTTAGVSLTYVLFTDPKFAGYWCNTGNGNYEYVNSNFLRIKRTGGEGIYIGNTASTTRSKIKQSHHTHLFIDSTGWDGVQLTSVNDLLIRKATVLHTGLTGGVGQNRLLQIQLSSGKVVKSIFSGSTSSVEVTSHDIIIDSVYFAWDNTDRIYIGNPSSGNGKPIIIDHSTFRVPVGTNPLLYVALKGADVIIRNCIISDNIKTLFTDNRGSGATNRLIDGGGNKFVPVSEIKVPVFKELDGDLVVADDFYYNQGYGSRTP